MTIAEFLAAAAARPWCWGEVDCCMVLADWIVANGYPDVAADLRGTYGTEAECKALLARRGGPLGIVTELAERAGLVRIDAPVDGAVAVIGSATVITRQWGAIWRGNRYLVRLLDEVVPIAAAPLAMWRVGP